MSRGVGTHFTRGVSGPVRGEINERDVTNTVAGESTNKSLLLTRDAI